MNLVFEVGSGFEPEGTRLVVKWIILHIDLTRALHYIPSDPGHVTVRADLDQRFVDFLFFCNTDTIASCMAYV